MFSLKKNNIVAGVLVVMVATAGYLNFTQKDEIKKAGEESYSYESILDADSVTVLADDTDDGLVLSDTSQESSDLENASADTSAVNLDPLTAQADDGSDNTGEAVFVNASAESADTYFAQAKLDREQSRAKQKDMLTEMINSSKLDDTQKQDFAKGILDLQQRIEKETASEDMIKAKGFKEAYVRIDDETVDVVVDSESITDQQAAQIMDIVKRKTGYAADKIRISALKK
ncbi:SpoIIIAH-like family protein [Lachnospiraceae bacterium NSJ-143]|nr:SpoIIIAH-like family protein [Lachnospiraceae bacterium NSJ-143]